MSFPACRYILLVFGLLSAACGSLWSDDAIEQGRQSLRSQVEYPWYDAENDRLRRVEVPEDEQAEEDADDQPTPQAAGGSAAGSGMSVFLQVVVWIFIALLFAAVVGALIWAFLRAENQRSSDSTEVVQSSREVDRIENLPFKIRTPQSDLLAEAQRHYEEGNFREAVIYLYSYKLVELDKHHRIRLTKGKTNRQYLREVRSQQSLAALLERTMVAFEDVFFGHHDLSRQRFERCWNDLPQFRRLVGEPGVVA